MNIFCIEAFMHEVSVQKKNNSYRDIETTIIDHFFSNELTEDFLKLGGANLNGSQEMPFIKKRLDGRGGYRIYYLYLIKKESIYLMYVHPKTGTLGLPEIGHEFKKDIYKKTFDSIANNDIYQVKTSDNKKNLVFLHIKESIESAK